MGYHQVVLQGHCPQTAALLLWRTPSLEQQDQDAVSTADDGKLIAPKKINTSLQQRITEDMYILIFNNPTRQTNMLELNQLLVIKPGCSFSDIQDHFRELGTRLQLKKVELSHELEPEQ